MNRQFGALRGLAIAIVTLNHSIYMLNLIAQELGYSSTGIEHYLLLILQQLGLFAVPTFLFISGCFFAYAAQGENPKLSYKTVWAGLKNILLPYVFWSIMFYLFIFGIQGTIFSPLGYVKNLIVGYPFHFVPLIVFFYLVSPILVKVSKRFGWIVIAVIALYQVVLINIEFSNVIKYAHLEWMRFLAPPIIRYTMAIWGIYFPLGVIYNLNAKTAMPKLVRFKWLFAIGTVVFFVISLLNDTGVMVFPFADYLAPISFVLLLPSIRRNSIPLVRQFEAISKRAYGIYLTNLILLSILLFMLRLVIPKLLHYQLLILPLLFTWTLSIPLIIGSLLERLRIRRVYSLVFG